MNPIILYRNVQEWKHEEKSANKNFSCVSKRTSVPPNSLVIARYSALPFYSELQDDLRETKSKLINSYQEHRYIADLQNWYNDLKNYTFKTWFRTQDLPEEGQFVLKGSTNSKKFLWNTHMFANSKREAIEVEGRLYNDSLIAEQDIVIREFKKLKTFDYSFNGLPITNEYRIFCYKNKVLSSGYYWSSHSEELVEKRIDLNPNQIPKDFISDIMNIASNNTNAYVVDVAETESGDWVLVELNDLQMSGLSDNNPDILYSNLRSVL